MEFKRRIITGLTAIAGLCASNLWAGTDAALPKTVQFNRDIRPILADNCYSCHGPDKDKRKAGLRLDTKDGLFTAIKGDTPVVPGKPDQSDIYKRIRSHDPDEVMPQSKTGKTLSDQQIALIKKWIEQGAKYEGHWAYNPLMRPAAPEVRRASWVKTPVDNFILARLQKEGLQPSPEADRRTLIRRLSFDLTGLPPKPDEVQAFVADKSKNAYEKVVDRLMASPHYGERMAVDWLDAVRYADTDGFHADNYRSVYPYRDYVINAFNSNMPLDRFTIEQLAGDLLPNPTTEQKIASTYNRLNRTTEEGGAQAKEYLAKYAADRVRTTSTAWLGATLGCAECHDHKFDPYTTKDFYSFEAFFADIKEVGVGKPEGTVVPNEEQLAELKKLDAGIKQVQVVLDTPTPELVAGQEKWEKQFGDQPPPRLSQWHSVGPFTDTSFESAFKKVFAPEKGMTNFSLTNTYQKGKLAWKAHPEWEDGKVYNGLTDNSRAAVYLHRTITVDAPQSLTLYFGSDDAIKAWVNGKQVVSNFVSRAAMADQDKATVQLQRGENTLLVKIVNNVGECGFYFKTSGDAPENILAIVKVKESERTESQKNELAKYYRSITPMLEKGRADVAAAKKRKDDYYATLPTTLVTVRVEPRTMRVLPRGNWMRDDGEIVTPSVPKFLPQAEHGTNRSTRLDLAHWLVAKDNPLTARVFVNRLWKQFYGTGITKSLDDSGSRAEWPTHPELLDWLASEFMDSGWDVKHIVKLMVMSETYRQSSVVTKKLEEKDPFNRLYARQSAIRLEAEMVRDNALAVSGLLVERIGGPSVKPYQPKGYWDQLNFPKRTYESDHGDAEYRRGLYTFWCRTYAHTSLLAFDAPSREECTVERVNSNTPMQALALLNDPTYVEAARSLAEQVVRHGGNVPKDRINYTYMQVLDRKPTAEEFKLLDELYQKQINRYTHNAENAGKLISAGEKPVAKDLNASELAAWTSICRVVLNLHETITRY
jgi:hypothetical protein